jgi:hypothetical protein
MLVSLILILKILSFNNCKDALPVPNPKYKLVSNPLSFINEDKPSDAAALLSNKSEIHFKLKLLFILLII